MNTTTQRSTHSAANCMPSDSLMRFRLETLPSMMNGTYQRGIMSSQEASRVRISRSPAQVQESQGVGPVFGLPCGESLARYDPDTQSLRTSQLLLFEDSTKSLVTLPRSGTMRNGRIYEQRTWVHRTKGKESGLWQTPNANEDRAECYTLETSYHHKQEGRQIHLAQEVRDSRLWPTPHANASTGPGGSPRSIATVSS